MLYRTDETADEVTLRTLYQDEDDEGPIPDRIETHSGAWVRDGDLWRWYQDDGEDE